MLESALPGYKIWTLGDDIAWLNVGPDGRLYAINPETGFFGVAPGTSMKTNPNMVRTLKADKFYPTLFTNVGLDLDKNEPWWEGADGAVPKRVADWQGKPWTPGNGRQGRAPQLAVHRLALQRPDPLEGIRQSQGRADLGDPARRQADPTGPAGDGGLRLGARRVLRRPDAARRRPPRPPARSACCGATRWPCCPFCGYNMGDYFGHWLNVGKRLKHPPKIYSVNWFRTDENGKFIWPGFGDNIRVIKWILDRVNGRVGARETPIGLVPNVADLDMSGLNIAKEKMEKLFEVDRQGWQAELQEIDQFLGQFGDHLPADIRRLRDDSGQEAGIETRRFKTIIQM